MNVKCPYCGSRKTRPILQLDTNRWRYKCDKCGQVFYYEKVYNEEGKLVKTIKLKAVKFPIKVGEFLFTKEDVEREFNNYLSMFKAFGIAPPLIYDDEYLYYFGDLTVKYDGYYAALYAGGIRVARKKVEDIE